MSIRDFLLPALAAYGGLTILGAVLALLIEAGSRLGLSRRAIAVIKGVVFATLALALGFLGLALFFSDGPPLAERFVVTAIAYPFFGLVTGYFNPRAWMIAGLAAWGPALLGVLGLFNQQFAFAVAVLLVPLGLALLGGFVGSRLRGK